jgi:hypothetical protein
MMQVGREEFIEKIFKKNSVFEKEVLNITNEDDRVEIMQILAKFIVGDVLKEELNFLYIQRFSDFTFKPIINILFKEIANEWIYFAMQELSFTKKEALLEIQTKKRVLFIRSLVESYYKNYKHYIFKEIADTFIELVENIPNANTQNRVVNEVLKSDLITYNNMVAVYNFRQLWNMVKNAQNLKQTTLKRLKSDIKKISKQLEKEQLSTQKRDKLSSSLKKNKKELKKLSKRSLDRFDEAIKRFKNTLVNSMLETDY